MHLDSVSHAAVPIQETDHLFLEPFDDVLVHLRELEGSRSAPLRGNLPPIENRLARSRREDLLGVNLAIRCPNDDGGYPFVIYRNDGV